LARLIRGHVTPALENVTLWHERDISHSSVERVIGPDATIALDFGLVRLANLIDRLVIHPENMRKNLDSFQGLVFSQRVLLALTQAGMSREDSYRTVQTTAMRVWDERKDDFRTLLSENEKVTALLSSDDLDAIFDYGYYTAHVDTILARLED
jgi:adenylosuccinate lyase